MKRGIVAVVVAVVGLACTAAPALAGCKVGVFAELPVTMSGLKPMVTAKIDGRDARFMADSGAFYSLITPGSAAEYGLKLGAAPYGMRIEGVGGVADVSVATVKTFTLANVPIPHVQFLVGGSETGGVGVLGQNVLGLADVEYDLAGGAIRLMKPKDCGQRILAYWAGTKAIGEVDVSPSTPYDPHTLGPVYLNGVKLRAMFDTGAGTSVVSLEAAARAGIKPGGSGVTPAGETGGLGRRLVKTWIAHVDSFKIDDEEIHNTQLFVSDLGLDGADMLLGADFFLAHRVYVANSQHKLYFTYNGGPVFRLDGAVMAQEGHEPLKASPILAGAGEPADAEGFSRRGAAFAARRDFEHALADFDRACTMAPAEPRYLYQRGMVRLENRQPVLALTDFDQALKLKPDDVATLLARAEMRLAQLGRAADGKAGEGKAGDGKAGDGRVGALADLDAAARAAAKSSDERLTIARLYASAFAFEPALVQTDLWIAAHPDDNQMGQALNGRCWTRAMLGRDLNKALSDCNAALRRQPAEAGFLDSRGLVRLRLGDLDRSIADYDAALALRPTNGWSLYGRGLARQRKGLKAEGDADIAAALALNPALADEARRAGLTP